MCSTANRRSSTRCCRRSRGALPACGWCSSTSPRARRRSTWPRAPANVAATITAHHLLLNRNAMFAGGIRPHHYCLPLLKRETHRRALVQAATGGNRKFFLGTDSAPHARRNKEAACGHAGIYSAHAAIELYAEAFEAAGALDRLEAFASFHGADFYRLPRNSGTDHPAARALAGAIFTRPGRRRAGAAARRRAARLAPAVVRHGHHDRTRLGPLGIAGVADVRHARATDRAPAGGPFPHAGRTEPTVRGARGGERRRRAARIRAAGGEDRRTLRKARVRLRQGAHAQPSTGTTCSTRWYGSAFPGPRRRSTATITAKCRRAKAARRADRCATH